MKITKQIDSQDEFTLREAVRIINSLSEEDQLEIEVNEIPNKEDLLVEISFQKPETLLTLGQLQEQLQTKHDWNKSGCFFHHKDIKKHTNRSYELRILIMRAFWLLMVIMFIFIVLMIMGHRNTNSTKIQLLRDISAYIEADSSSIYKPIK